MSRIPSDGEIEVAARGGPIFSKNPRARAGFGSDRHSASGRSPAGTRQDLGVRCARPRGAGSDDPTVDVVTHGPVARRPVVSTLRVRVVRAPRAGAERRVTAVRTERHRRALPPSALAMRAVAPPSHAGGSLRRRVSASGPPTGSSRSCSGRLRRRRTCPPSPPRVDQARG